VGRLTNLLDFKMLLRLLDLFLKVEENVTVAQEFPANHQRDHLSEEKYEVFEDFRNRSPDLANFLLI